jgi:hypothetical protein
MISTPRIHATADGQTTADGPPLTTTENPALEEALAGPVSGLYVWSQHTQVLPREELRLDVDGNYPQMVASGTICVDVSSRTDWIAKLEAAGPDVWTGAIWYKAGSVVNFPFNSVDIEVTRGTLSQPLATVTFTGAGSITRMQTFRFASPFFRQVDFEFDFAQGEETTLSFNTCDHPTRPLDAPCEELTIEQVYRRSGFDVTISPSSEVPVLGAGADARWTCLELHDAMQTFWSRRPATPRAEWAMWVFFASLAAVDEPAGILHPEQLGGMMFDDIGPNHRQGTAIFNDALTANPPENDANPEAWRRRMLFWTVCHEIGHAFNLAHTWAKAGGTPWMLLVNELSPRSFMNYPRMFPGGQAAYFSRFQFRFGDPELLFLRHAPERFVQTGNAAWFDNHGFQGAETEQEPTFALVVRINRERPVYEFLEPVTIELKLTNISPRVQSVPDSQLVSDELTVVLKREGYPARQYLPFAQICRQSERRPVAPGASVYDSLFVAAGRNGWDIAEPGRYTIRVATQIDGVPIISNPLHLRVAPPRAYDEELLAQDFFSQDVGRVLTFDGSHVLSTANETLCEVAERLSDRSVALHARLALGNALARSSKELSIESAADDRGMAFRVREARPEEARKLLADALVGKPAVAIESFGHVQGKRYFDRFTDWLSEAGDPREAAQCQGVLYETMARREIHGRKVLAPVLTQIQERLQRYQQAPRA